MYTFNMLVPKPSWITLLLFLCQHDVMGRNALVCEGDTANLLCSEGHIKVSEANYGRTDRTTCSEGRPESQMGNVHCIQETSIQKMSLRCDGKKSCSVPAKNSIFSDPCHGIYKYLDVTYECIPSKRAVICEHNQNEISCDSGLILIQYANYGRRDRTTCPNQHATSDCYSSQIKRLQSSCNGRRTCSLFASNSVFGDPCYGVYKYLEVTYSCEPGD
ncbi:L-rhamnose-binding lectin CSL3 [Misgurnus anguillicaudatus]|uniref:L-rhamnose-binding lectin CSL3 n=1 Tax=Misgurnus anguillicaudatus TaxID=75329 RepID=UPI003CCF2F0C